MSNVSMQKGKQIGMILILAVSLLVLVSARVNAYSSATVKGNVLFAVAANYSSNSSANNTQNNSSNNSSNNYSNTGAGGCGCIPAISIAPSFQFKHTGQQVQISSIVLSYGCGCVRSDTYQWYNDTSGVGVAIPGATGLNLNETAGTQGTFYYYVTISDSLNTNQSNVATVHISGGRNCGCGNSNSTTNTTKTNSTTTSTNSSTIPSTTIQNYGGYVQTGGRPPSTTTIAPTTTIRVVTTIPTTTTIPIAEVPEAVPHSTTTVHYTTTVPTGNYPITVLSQTPSGTNIRQAIMENFDWVVMLVAILLIILTMTFAGTRKKKPVRNKKGNRQRRQMARGRAK